jgi:hypothetical protein
MQRTLGKFVSGLLLASFAAGGSAQSLPISWTTANGGSGDDYGWSIAVDPEGNSYVAGHFGENAVFGGKSVFTRGNNDIFLLKLNPKGEIVWITTAGGRQDDEGHALVLDPNGNIYLTGYFEETASFGTQSITAAGKTDIFIACYNAQGQLLWLKQAGGSGDDVGTGIALASDGNLYLTGAFSEQMQLGSFNLTSAGGSDIFLAKIDPTGNVLWAKQAGGPGNDQAERVTLDRAGGLYVVGEYSTNAVFGSTSPSCRGRTDIFLAKYTLDGDPLWLRTAGGTNVDYGWDVKIDSSQNVIITGTTAAEATFENTVAIAGGQTDIFAAKYAPGGELIWVRAFGGTGPDQANGVAVDPKDNIYLTGYYIDTVPFGQTTYAAPSHADFFVLKLSPAGDVLWSAAAHGTAYSQARAVAVTPGGAVFATGYFRGSTSFGPASFSNQGGRDLFVARIDPEPRLEIWLAKEGTILQWPANPATFRLEGNGALGGTSGWTTLVPARRITTDFRTFTNSPAGAAQFFRLRQ